MQNLTFEQKIALQMGELILEVKRLETIRDQLSSQLAKAEKEAPSKGIQSTCEISNTLQT